MAKLKFRFGDFQSFVIHVLIQGNFCLSTFMNCEWLDGVMVLGKLPVLGHPTSLGNGRLRAYCTFSRCRWGLFGYFLSLSSIISLLLSPSLWEMARYRLKYCLKGLLNPKQSTNFQEFYALCSASSLTLKQTLCTTCITYIQV